MALFALRVFAVIALLACGLCFAATDTPDALLQRADQLKTVDNSKFETLLKQLDTQADTFTQTQRDWLHYLHGWQLGYQGMYLDGASALQNLIARTQDPTVRARARVSLINDQANASHYVDAYTTLAALLDSLPEIEDRYARFNALIIAALQYNEAGQYDLAINYMDKSLATDTSDRSTCIALATKAEALSKSGKLRADNTQIQSGLEACERANETLYANLIRADQAQALIGQGHIADALKLLKGHDKQVVASKSAFFISAYRARMARCFLLIGNPDKAMQYAQSAVDYGIKEPFSNHLANAYNVLYEIAKRQGDFQNALAFDEKYVAADKAFLKNISARALAYQTVHQKVQDTKRQIDTLREQNKVLQLKQQVDAKSTEARHLYILLLLAGFALVVMWAYRTKRAQLKFQTLAQRDGLTEISNRQHFFDAAQERLRYCAKNARDAVVIAMDLDHFKAINDMHGHAAGDATLKRVVGACKERLHSIDIFGRLGGEEFAILMPDCNAVVAAHRANEMRQAIAALSASANATNDVVVTASFGIAATSVCGYSLTTLLAHADNALYSAKHAGRNRVVVHRAGAEAKQAKPDNGINVSESADV
ncbi:MAG: GGDEF domain-containing protein [Rudaea sp.]